MFFKGSRPRDVRIPTIMRMKGMGSMNQENAFYMRWANMQLFGIADRGFSKLGFRLGSFYTSAVLFRGGPGERNSRIQNYPASSLSDCSEPESS